MCYSGPHRPLWPVYGEYLYLPPQRWVHSLEVGYVKDCEMIHQHMYAIVKELQKIVIC